VVGSQASTEGSAEIASGRANSQQGLAATCKDLMYKGKTEASEGFWSGAGAGMSDEGGVMPSDAAHRGCAARGNALSGQRDSR